MVLRFTQVVCCLSLRIFDLVAKSMDGVLRHIGWRQLCGSVAMWIYCDARVPNQYQNSYACKYSICHCFAMRYIFWIPVVESYP